MGVVFANRDTVRLPKWLLLLSVAWLLELPTPLLALGVYLKRLSPLINFLAHTIVVSCYCHVSTSFVVSVNLCLVVHLWPWSSLDSPSTPLWCFLFLFGRPQDSLLSGLRRLISKLPLVPGSRK
jgi:hypothetical protein